MSPSARERRALSAIGADLTQSDAVLAARLAEFTRQAAGAAMPAAERRRPASGLTRWLGRLTRRRHPGRQPDRSQPGTASRF